MSGTAKSLDFFRQTSPLHSAMGPQCFGDSHRIGWRRVLNWPHTPERSCAKFCEGAVVEANDTVQFYGWLVHMRLLLA